MTIRPASSRTSTTSSRSRCMACITEAGIRTAALLPHFFTVALMGAPPVSTLYLHYAMISNLVKAPGERAYSHRRMSLKTCREVDGSRFSFRVVFGSFGADQREAHGALNRVLVSPSWEGFVFC